MLRRSSPTTFMPLLEKKSTFHRHPSLNQRSPRRQPTGHRFGFTVAGHRTADRLDRRFDWPAGSLFVSPRERPHPRRSLRSTPGGPAIGSPAPWATLRAHGPVRRCDRAERSRRRRRVAATRYRPRCRRSRRGSGRPTPSSTLPSRSAGFRRDPASRSPGDDARSGSTASLAGRSAFSRRLRSASVSSTMRNSSVYSRSFATCASTLVTPSSRATSSIASSAKPTMSTCNSRQVSLNASTTSW